MSQVITGTVDVDQINDSIVIDDTEPVSVYEAKAETVFETDSGVIHVLHEITLGDVIISTLLLCLLIFFILERIIRR